VGSTREDLRLIPFAGPRLIRHRPPARGKRKKKRSPLDTPRYCTMQGRMIIRPTDRPPRPFCPPFP
jgi:hypothetical protein